MCPMIPHHALLLSSLICPTLLHVLTSPAYQHPTLSNTPSAAYNLSQSKLILTLMCLGTFQILHQIQVYVCQGLTSSSDSKHTNAIHGLRSYNTLGVKILCPYKSNKYILWCRNMLYLVPWCITRWIKSRGTLCPMVRIIGPATYPSPTPVMLR